MKKTYLVLFAFVPVIIFTSTVFAFRCGPDNKYIAHEGMHKYQILKDCGQPLSRETVGANYGGGWYRYVEEWVYIENGYGGNQYMYLIRFDEAGIAREIKYLGEQK